MQIFFPSILLPGFKVRLLGLGYNCQFLRLQSHILVHVGVEVISSAVLIEQVELSRARRCKATQLRTYVHVHTSSSVTIGDDRIYHSKKRHQISFEAGIS